MDNVTKTGRVLAALMIVNAALFVLLSIVNSIASDGIAGKAVDILALSPSPVVLAVKPWTILSYSFFQTDGLHLAFNLLWLYSFGRLWDTAGLSPRSILTTYLTGAATGGLFYISGCLLTQHPSSGPLLGSSAAVIAIGTHLAVKSPGTRLYLPVVGPVKIKWTVTVMVAIFAIGLTSPNTGGNLAHLGGAAAGLITALKVPGPRGYRHPSDSIHRSTLKHLSDKIRHSGYESLTDTEKRLFLELSNDRRWAK